ncbi:ABC transporter ATP-binding protein [Corynebacterium oculi]|uniref:Lipoprotein-releasing system ATP-binding protein LolD n=1 Tax=Corynebacterium oculi TaxID=1544416 RepID=A0A0Q0Z356_9CORY|nr:ATP-binding cassette domain-containing protein [Corynebacterium oculi]KQB83699.1 Lipoprotein-releasing system ATP-binding protein LolD [Corynebacterium oculi]
MMIRGAGLGFSFGDKVVFQGINMEVNPGTIAALVGPSGSGKTLLLHTLGGMITPDRGAVYVDGEESSAWSDTRRLRFWRESAAFIQQDYGVVEEESVAFNVTMRSSLWGRTIVPDHSKLDEVLARVGLSGRAGETAARLSGGEKQRVAIARALYKGAQVWFADEPTASLDADNQGLVRTLFREAAEKGATIIVATHDLDFARSCEQRVELGSQR